MALTFEVVEVNGKRRNSIKKKTRDEVARITGVKKTSIGSIMQGRGWNHVTGLPKKRKSMRSFGPQNFELARPYDSIDQD